MSVKLEDLKGYKCEANDLSKGNVIIIENELYEVIDLDRVKPGKGGAFVQTTLKNILTDRKLTPRFRSEDSVSRIDIYEIKCTFFWDDEDTITFLRADNKNNQEQICVNKRDFPKYSKFIGSSEYTNQPNDTNNIYLIMLDDGKVIDIKY